MAYVNFMVCEFYLIKLLETRDVAQLVEYLLSIHEVLGSILRTTKNHT